MKGIFTTSVIYCRLLITVAAGFFAVSAAAQSGRLTYDGKYRVFDSIPGVAAFEYRLVDGDTVKDGHFSFQHFVENYRQTDSIYGYELNGGFKNNIKDGPWQFVSRKIAITGNVKASGAQVVYDASGQEYLMAGYFDNGKLDGNYEILHRRLEDSQPVDTFLYVRLQYTGGLITGSLEGFTDNMRVRGQFDQDGFPYGNWTFLHNIGENNQLEEIRYYDHGFFSRHYYKIQNQLVEIRHIGFDTLAKSGRGLLTRLPATDTYFRALDYTNVVMDTMGISGLVNTDSSHRYISNANAFMQNVFINPGVYDKLQVWQGVEGSAPVPPVRIKISKFSFTEEERILNRDNEKLLTEINSLLDDFFKNPNTETGRFNNSTLGKYYRVLDIYKNRLSSITPVITFLADSASEYVNHDAILQHNAVAISYPEKIEYTFEDQLVSDSHPFPAPLREFKSATLHDHMLLVFEDVTAILKKIESAFSEYQAQSALTVAEARLISLRDSVIHLFTDSVANKDKPLPSALKTAVREQVEQLFKAYAGLPVISRLRAIDSVEYCFATYTDLYATLLHFQEKLSEIDREYTRSVWNAYTYTYMEERVKERLYSVFEKELFPYMWKRLQEDLSCSRVSGRLDSIDRLLQRMLELRMEDTKELERNLRRAKGDKAAYLRLLNLEGNAVTPRE